MVRHVSRNPTDSPNTRATAPNLNVPEVNLKHRLEARSSSYERILTFTDSHVKQILLYGLSVRSSKGMGKIPLKQVIFRVYYLSILHPWTMIELFVLSIRKLLHCKN